MSPDEERYPRPTPPHPQRAPLLLVVSTSHTRYILWSATYAAQRARFRKRGGRRAGILGSPHPPPSGPPESPTNQELNVRSHGAPSLLKGWLLGFPSLSLSDKDGRPDREGSR